VNALLRDLRFAISVFFLLLGAILVSLPEEHAPLTTGPVNAQAGAGAIVFGVVMLGLALRTRQRNTSAR
jgi:hypothetical protein